MASSIGEQMKVLTLTQPWATLIALGLKQIETRSWKTNYRGILAIHAAKGFPGWAKNVADEDFFREINLLLGPGVPSEYLPVGKILCVCALTDVKRTEDIVDQDFYNTPEAKYGDYNPFRYGWILNNRVTLDTPVPAKGKLGIWNFPEVDLWKVNPPVIEAEQNG